MGSKNTDKNKGLDKPAKTDKIKETKNKTQSILLEKEGKIGKKEKKNDGQKPSKSDKATLTYSLTPLKSMLSKLEKLSKNIGNMQKEINQIQKENKSIIDSLKKK